MLTPPQKLFIAPLSHKAVVKGKVFAGGFLPRVVLAHATALNFAEDGFAAVVEIERAVNSVGKIVRVGFGKAEAVAFASDFVVAENCIL